jgi:hypothetical protein
MGEIRDREYLRFVVEEENVRALSVALQRIVEERSAAGPR